MNCGGGNYTSDYSDDWGYLTSSIKEQNCIGVKLIVTIVLWCIEESPCFQDMSAKRFWVEESFIFAPPSQHGSEKWKEQDGSAVAKH